LPPATRLVPSGFEVMVSTTPGRVLRKVCQPNVASPCAKKCASARDCRCRRPDRRREGEDRRFHGFVLNRISVGWRIGDLSQPEPPSTITGWAASSATHRARDSQRVSNSLIEVGDVRWGSIATEMRFPRHVRFPPVSDQIADIAGGPFCANRRHRAGLT
jgi:hypothetical protein